MCTCASFIIMWAKTWRNPTIASHSLLWLSDCWLPVHGPWREKPCVTCIKAESKCQISFRFYLNIFSQAVENLFRHHNSFGEILFAGIINDVLARVIPVEITDRLLDYNKMRGKSYKYFETLFLIGTKVYQFFVSI